jgi:hypothetical protein
MTGAQMSEIQRYGFGDLDAGEAWGDTYPKSDGLYVRHVDHIAEVQRLRDEMDDYQCRLWCALGQPLDIEYIEAVKQVRAENDRLGWQVRVLRDALADAEHLCRWLLQSDVGAPERELVTRENGTMFALILAQTEPRP